MRVGRQYCSVPASLPVTSERIAELDSLHATEAPFLGCGLCDDGQPAETADRTGLGGLCVGRRDRRETRDHRGSPYFFSWKRGIHIRQLTSTNLRIESKRTSSFDLVSNLSQSKTRDQAQVSEMP